MNSWLFYLPLLAYFLTLLFFTYQVTRQKIHKDHAYFLAGNRISPYASMLSIMATETSVATIMIFPAVGMKSNFVLLWLCAGYILGRILIALYYLPKLYGKHEVSIYQTITGSSARAKNIMSSAYLLAKFISSGVRFFMASYALAQLFGGSIFIWSIATACVVALYSIGGGMRAVVLTDQLQAYIILALGILLCVLLYPHDGLQWTNIFWINTQASYSNALFFPALLLGGLVVSLGSHAADQDLIQRVLATPNLKAAQKGMICSGFAASLVIMLYLFIGILLQQSAVSVDTQSPLIGYLQHLNQPLLMGLFAVLIFAAAMSTLDSAINSTAAIWKSLLHDKLSNRGWSTLSLLCLLVSALSFIELQKYSNDFLSLAMGSMNYINGALIGILTLFIFAPKKICSLGVGMALVVGFLVTYGATWHIAPALAWTWTVIVSSLSSMLAAYLGYVFSNTQKFN